MAEERGDVVWKAKSPHYGGNASTKGVVPK